MASQDYISQFTQGIPATQPERSPSRTPIYELRHFCSSLSGTSSHGRPAVSHSMLRLHTHMDPTEITNDAAFHISISHAVELYGTTSPVSSATFPSDATSTLSSTTTSSGIRYTSTIHYSITKVTLIHPNTFNVANPQIRPCEIPAMPHWKPDVDFHDTGKTNGIDFPATVRSSKFSQYKDIEGMGPLQIPFWKFLYQGLNNTWLRRIAHGRDVFVLPFDNIGTTVFVAELVQQLKAHNVDLDRLAAYRTRQQGTQLQQKEATQHMAREVAQHMQSWLPPPVGELIRPASNASWILKLNLQL